MMNSKRGFKRITFALAAVAAISGTVVGVNIVVNEYEDAKAGSAYRGGYILPDIEGQNELESDLPSTPNLVGLCVAAGLIGALIGFSLTWLVVWLGGLAIYKFIKWIVLGFCDDANNKQVEVIKAE